MVLPWMQVKPSSRVPSPSSSQPLQNSVAATHEPASVQGAEQLRVPGVPHDVAQPMPLLDCTHANVSSRPPSQSSSAALQTSVAPGYVVARPSLQSPPRL